MSTGKTKTFRSASPAKTSREADARWGLKSGFAGAAQRGSLDAYTVEHYQADIDAGVIDITARSCPRQRPERDCPTTRPGPKRKGESNVAAPEVTGSLWTRYAVMGAWTIGGARPQRTLIFKAIPVCFDCRMYVYWSDRQDFFGAAGFDHGLGYVRPTFAIRQLWGEAAAEEVRQFITTTDELDRVYGDGRIRTYLEAEDAAAQLYWRERADLTALAGALPDEILQPHEMMRRYEQASLLSIVRHCVTCYIAARADLPQPSPRVRLMS